MLSRLLALSLLVACASPPEPAPPPAAPVLPPPAAAARKELPPGWAERETRRAATLEGRFIVWWTSEPEPIPFNQPFKLRVWAARAETPDTPLTDATFEVSATMPEHGHGMNRVPRVTPQPDGSHLVEGMLFHMHGRWDLIINVHAGGSYGQAIMPQLLE
jgi:hypothetical protein